MRFLIYALVTTWSAISFAQMPKVPSLPSSSFGSGNIGLQGSVGAGFVDFRVQSPSADFKIDRGIYVAGQIERGFNVMHLYLTLSLSHMQAEGLANYQYSNLSNSTTYTAQDIKFKSSVTDLALGLKLKIIDHYWFRPYIEGGGLGGYHQISYSGKTDVLSAQGSDYKSKDVVMGSGYYGEAGLEAMFSEKFGVKLAARESIYQTKKLETLADRPLRFNSETYYFSLLFGM
jgi:hypothetical protein